MLKPSHFSTPRQLSECYFEVGHEDHFIDWSVKVGEWLIKGGTVAILLLIIAWAMR